MLEGIGREYIFDIFEADVGLELHLDNMRHAARHRAIMIPVLLMGS